MADDFRALYKSYTTPMCDAPIIFHEFVALSILGAALGDKVYFRWQDRKIFPNIWLCLVAPSSTFRKSTCLDFGTNILRLAKPEALLSPSFSAESLWDILQDQPQGIFVYSEFNELVGMLSRDYASGARAFLAKLYDCPPAPLNRKLRGKEWVIDGAVVSMLAGTTTNFWLAKREDLTGGFLVRWLFVGAKIKGETIAFPPPADMKKQNALVAELKKISTLKGEIKFSDEARRYYASWLKQYESREFGDQSTLNPFLSRYGMYALKLAMILEIAATRKSIVSLPAMKEATGLINFVSRELATLASEEWAFSAWERSLGRVLKLIRENAGNGGISRRDLVRKTRIKSRDLQEILANLLEGGEIKAERKEQDKAGPNPTLYFPVKATNNSSTGASIVPGTNEKIPN